MRPGSEGARTGAELGPQGLGVHLPRLVERDAPFGDESQRGDPAETVAPEPLPDLQGQGGRIAPDLYADLVVLDRDPYAVTPAELRDLDEKIASVREEKEAAIDELTRQSLRQQRQIDELIAHVETLQRQLRELAEAAGARFEISHRFEDAFDGADAVVPKSWGPLMTTRDTAEGLALIEKYPSWRCDQAHMQLGARDLIYMHPLPADRGREVTDEVIDGPQSVVYDEAENRLHVQKALMALTM